MKNGPAVAPKALILLLAALFSSFVVRPEAAAPTAQPLESVSSMEAVRRMGLGWNLGNTLEACGDWIKGRSVHDYETAWGNPDTTRAMIAAIRRAGFGSVRIPVAWSNLMGPGYAINPALVRRVAEVAGWVQAEGMVAVVNIHWDGGWWSKFPTRPDESMARYTRMWSQIATAFKDQPATLIFESLNEEGSFPDVWNEYTNSGSKSRAFGILNSINQKFVDVVRSSGGMNAKRHLLIAGYATNIDHTSDPLFKMPQDLAGHCIVSIHYYEPATFAILDKDASWGRNARNWGSPAEVAVLEKNLRKLKIRFLDKGVPVIMGEYGSGTKNKDPQSVRRFALTVAGKAYALGICPMVWDAGQYFDRRKLAFIDPGLAEGYRKISEAPRP